jgi:arginine deiminase
VCNVSPSSQKEDCLRDSLLNDKFISRLCLSKSIISHELTQVLVHASQEHRSLTHLEFYENQIDADDVSQLQSLYENEILIHLIISEKPHGHSGQEETKDGQKTSKCSVNRIQLYDLVSLFFNTK